MSLGRLALSAVPALLRPTASGFVRTWLESEADMAATQRAASEGPAASMAAPCGDFSWARPSWHGLCRTAEARAPLGSLSRQGGLLVIPGSRRWEMSQAGSAGGSCCETRAPELEPRRRREVSSREFCYRTWNCFSKGVPNCSCRGKPGKRMTDPAVKETRKASLDQKH